MQQTNFTLAVAALALSAASVFVASRGDGDKGHVLPAAVVEKAWPELKRRRLLDREQARLADLKQTKWGYVPF